MPRAGPNTVSNDRLKPDKGQKGKGKQYQGGFLADFGPGTLCLMGPLTELAVTV